ncbi:MAG TPA: M43 family zinc metalloprotease [Chitinophagaceae bacterium]|nr:M43 family zinc metalloprotease [Chitinophagaceae bacterium]
MRIILIVLSFVLLGAPVAGQSSCYTSRYQQLEMQQSPWLKQAADQVEQYTQQRLQEQTASRGGSEGIPDQPVIIPVVVHILYHKSSENISNDRVYQQIEVLNQAFQRRNADTANTPEHFRHLAGNANIRFELAISDPQRRATTGIVRKYTSVQQWKPDDKMKYSAEMGSDAWDSNSYLNIWVCNIGQSAGYASFPGGPVEKDGVVLNFYAFGLSGGAYGLGKTAVHEVGHWLNLRHIWGDDYCGDDLVSDTPQQHYFTMGCPSGIRSSCDNKPDGDMYMNYMDLTQDACTNMFTKGQVARMRVLFEPKGIRSGILTSYALKPPLFSEIPVGDEGVPQWLHPHIYPNPASSSLTIDLAYDTRWTGKTLLISTITGQRAMEFTVTGKITTVDISRLAPGYYYVMGKRGDGSTIRQKFLKN